MQSRSTIGYLTKQYRAILKKYFLVFAGLYAICGSAFSVKAQTYEYLGYNLDDYLVVSADQSNLPLATNSIISAFNKVDTVEESVFSVMTDNGLKYFEVIQKTSPSYVIDTTRDNLSDSTASINKYYIGIRFAQSYWSDGGALNLGRATDIPSINADFISNYINVASSSGVGGYGGALLNGGSITNLTGSFVGNYVTTSGANEAFGGAIHNSGSNNRSAKITNLSANFIGNYVYSGGKNAGGGAILNGTNGGASYALITNLKGVFINNNVNGATLAKGGAIYNYAIFDNFSAKIEDIQADFVGNYVISTSGIAYGGAIANEYLSTTTNSEAVIGNVSGSFVGNYASSTSGSALGGAIYNSATINIHADTEDVIFKDNYTLNGSTKNYNAIYNTGTINLTADEDFSIMTYDSFEGNGTYNLKTGTLSLQGANAKFASVSNLNVTAGTKISTIDKEIRETTLGNLKLNGDVYYGIDINVANLTGDELTGTLVEGSTGELIINEINVLGTTNKQDIEINLTNNFSGIINLATNETITEGYDAITYEKTTGVLTLKYAYTLNDAVIDATTDKSYNMDGPESITKTLGTMAGESLIINGNHNNITASAAADGMSMTTGQTISLNNIGTISGFTTSFINATGGDVNITNSDTSKTTTIQSSITGIDNLTISGEVNFFDTTVSADNIVIGDEDIILDSSTISGNISGGSGDILTNGNATITNSVVDVTIESGAGSPLTIRNSTISGAFNAGGEVLFSGTNIIDGTFNANSIVSNTGILNVNSNFVLTSSFSGGGTLNFNDASKTLTFASGYGTPSITNTTFNMGAGTLKSSGDGTITNYNIGNATLTDTKLDVDFFVNEDGTIDSDVFVGATNTSSAILEAITVNPATVSANIDGASGFIKIFEDGSNVSVSSGLSGDELLILTDTYTLGLTSALNGLDYTIKSAINTLEIAITSTASPRQYIMNKNETAGVHNMEGVLSIMGGGNQITGGSITMLEDADLTLNNLTMGANIVGGTNTTVNIEGNVNYLNAATITGTTIDLTADSTLKFANDASFNNGSNSLEFNGGNLNIANGGTNIIKLSSLKLNSNTNWSIDVDLKKEEMDTIEVAGTVGDGNLNIAHLNLLSDSIIDEVVINFTKNTDLMDNVFYTGKNPIAYSNLYKYDVSYNNKDGNFTFDRQEGDSGFTSAIQVETVSNQNIYTATVDLSKNLLAAVDASSPLSGMASGDEGSNYEGAWVKTYGSNEDVNLGHLTIDNKTYAGILGVDFKPELTKNGYHATYSIYAAYLNSTQEYDDVTIEQNGINFGGRAMYSKGNYFNAVVANLGFNLIDGKNMFGDEDFETYTASLSYKAGFDIDLYDCKYFMQPSISASYIYAYTTDYTNSTGVKITSDALHAFNINPQLKFVAELDNDYTPYASIGYNWNIEEGGKVKANNIALPELSVDPYAEYKVGVSKEFDSEISGFAEISATTGGRQGYAAQAGLKWAF